MDVKKTYHVYIGINYKKLPSEDMRPIFSTDAEEICLIINLPKDNCEYHSGSINKSDIRKILADLKNEKYKGYDILIYISGHGQCDKSDNKTYLMTTDWENDDWGIRFRDILEQIEENPFPDNIAVILDSCHSGLKDITFKRDLYWIAASSESANNLFHENLVDYLHMDNDDLTIAGLMDYLQKRGKMEQPTAIIKSQKPFYIQKTQDHQLTLIDINNYLLLKRGRSRTAYPINLNFAQICERNLYLDINLIENHDIINSNSFLSYCIDSKSSLILGNPGSGKSFFAFVLQKKFINKGFSVIALSLHEMQDIMMKEESSLNDSNKQIKKIIQQSLTNSKVLDKTVFIIDGLDEYNNWDEYNDYLSELTKNVCVIALSRGIEYNNNVSKFIHPDIFDRILKIKEWTYENEFKEFLDCLYEKHQIKEECYKAILNDAEEFNIVLTTPLNSRMYIYVYEEFNSDTKLSIQNKAQLYFLYIQKVSSENDSIINFWSSIAQEAFMNQRNNYSLISESEYTQKIDTLPFDIRRIIPHILQLKRNVNGSYYNFIHYSFFEFFVAFSIYSELKDTLNSKNNTLSISKLLQLDLTFQIRHYLIDLIKSDQSLDKEQFIEFLYSFYQLITESHKFDLIKKNIVIYLLSKVETNRSLEQLKKILEIEDNIFIKNALYWAFARLKINETFTSYIHLLSNRDDYCSYNRGYHLYYYGDLIYGNFPYIDNDCNSSWRKTREFMMKYRIDIQKDNSPLICLLDIWTFIDLAIFHNTPLEDNELDSLVEHYRLLKNHLNSESQNLFDKQFNLIKLIEND